jgi:hypothetical protein
MSHNRTVIASPPSTARATQNTSRACVLCGVLRGHIFCAHKKTSVDTEINACQKQRIPVMNGGVLKISP